MDSVFYGNLISNIQCVFTEPCKQCSAATPTLQAHACTFACTDQYEVGMASSYTFYVDMKSCENWSFCSKLERLLAHRQYGDMISPRVETRACIIEPVIYYSLH
jgi:hypothetical protein